MIDLPMSGFAGRGELKNALTEILARDKKSAQVINIYGEEGTGKSTLVAAATAVAAKKSLVTDIDLTKKYLRFPENGLIAIRQDISAEFADHFSLFDVICLMRIERINGRIPTVPSAFFKNNSEILRQIFEKYSSDNYFSRNLYKAVEEGVITKWFEKNGRKAVMKLFKDQNHMNWDSLIDTFAAGMRSYKEKSGRDMVIIFENCDQIAAVDDAGLSWTHRLAERAGCGIFIYLSRHKLSGDISGKQDFSAELGNFETDDAMAYFDSIGVTRESVVLAIYGNTGGNPALMSYCVETSDMISESTGREPMPDVFQADPESIVHFHLSNLKSDVAAFAKVMSAVRMFNGELFEAMRTEFVTKSDRRTLPIKVFTDLRFVERLGGGYFAVQEVYKREAVKTLDPDTLENVHYVAYQYHTAKLTQKDNQYSHPLHIYEALYHAKATLQIDGFIMWFRGLEKEHLSAENFNMWLGIYEDVRGHVAGVLGETHDDTVVFSDTLAYLYLKGGRPLDAEKTMKATLDAYIETFGKNTAQTVPQMNKLANIYIQTGDLNAAEQILINGLTIRQSVHGENHAETADSMMRLSNFYRQIGKKGEALEFLERAQAILNNQLDINDDKRIEAEETMASIYADTKNMAKAVQLYKKISTIKKEKHGEYAKETVKSLADYAESVLKNGQPAKAVKIYEELFEKTRRVYGDNSKAAAAAVNDLAYAYQKNKEYEKAEAMHKRALKMKDQIYGDNHPSTATSYSNYGQLKYLTGDLVNAEMSYKKAAHVYETVLGKAHPKTALGFNNLGFLTSRMGHFEKAEKYYLDSLESKKALGEEKTVSVASTLNNLGELMYRMGRKDEAEKYLTQALDIYKEILGDEHPSTEMIAKNLVAVRRV